ncbi:MAG: hypothetical protein ACTHME_03195 [Candidatus Nitrosocosmicus sp.]
MENKFKKNRKSNPLIIGTAILVVSFVILMQISFAESAHALTKFEACVVNIANSKGKFTLDDANNCYTKEFKGAQGANDDGFPTK